MRKIKAIGSIVVVSVAVIVAMSGISAFRGRQLKEQYHKLALKGYNDIYLGMSEKDFRRVRPRAQYDPSTDAYYEDSKHAFYNSVGYDFRGFINIKYLNSFLFRKLDRVYYVGKFDKKYIDDHECALVAACVSKWGGYEKKIITNRDGDFKWKVLRWNKGRIKVEVCIGDYELNGGSDISISILANAGHSADRYSIERDKDYAEKHLKIEADCVKDVDL